MRRSITVLLGFAAITTSGRTSGAQAQPLAQLKLKAPVKIATKPRVLATRFTGAQLIARLQTSTAGRQTLATAHLAGGGTSNTGSTATAADGWPTSFAFTVNANQLSSSQSIATKSIGVQVTHAGVVINSDGAGSFTVSLMTDYAATPVTELSVSTLPAGWYAIAFEFRNVSGSPALSVVGGNLFNLVDPSNWSGQCAASELTPDTSGNSACVVGFHLTQAVGNTTIMGALTSGDADLLGVTISRLGM